MKTTELSHAAVLAAAATIPEGSPIFVLNLLRYRERADYGERAGIEPCSGRQAYYERYLAAFGQVAAGQRAEGIEVFYVGTALACLVAPSEERWDDVAIVRYPDFATFRRVTESAQYHAEAAHHRRAALEDWRLIVTAKRTLPG